MPIMDAFWGDRYGQVVDPCGHKWSIATRKWNLTDEEKAAAAKKAFEVMAKGQSAASQAARDSAKEPAERQELLL
jgi:PhnB protein